MPPRAKRVLEPPLEYVRMYVEVIGWVREAQDEDECTRLSELAEFYLNLSIASCEQECERLTEQLPTDLQRDSGRADTAPSRHINRTEFEVLRGRSAVTSGSQLQHATYSELQDLADMVEGWAQDPLRNAVEVARLLGIADGLRNLAEVAGPNWRPPMPETNSLTTFLARLI